MLAIWCERVEVLGVALAGDALVMAAHVGGVDGDMGDAGLFPEANLAPPVLVLADAGRHPDFQADRGGISAGRADEAAQLVESLQRLVARRIGERHEAVAVLGGAPEGRLGMAAEPDRHAARLRSWIDAAVVELMEIAPELDVWFSPQRLHEAHLFLGALAPGAEIHAETLELDLVPADADAKAELAPLAQRVETRRLLGDQGGLALRQDHNAGRAGTLT